MQHESDPRPAPSPALPDEILAKGVLAADPEAFALFYERTLRRVHAYLGRRLGTPDGPAVEALTEEVLVRAVAGLAGRPGDRSLAEWTLALCRAALRRAGHAA